MGPFKRRLFQHVLRLKRDIYRNKILRNQYFFFFYQSRMKRRTKKREKFSKMINRTIELEFHLFNEHWSDKGERCMEEMFE